MTLKPNKVLISWSGGKDSAVLLNKLQNSPDTEVAGILTTLSGGSEVNLHHVPRKLIEEQARSLNLPLFPAVIPEKAPNKVYEEVHRKLLQDAYNSHGIRYVAFGDLFLKDIRRYRESMFKNLDIAPVFPLWGTNSRELIRNYLNAGFKAICVAARRDLPGEHFAGKVMGEKFFRELPADIDICGENGEYHSFVYHGPGFDFPVPVSPGKPLLKDYNPEADLQMYLSYLHLKE